MGITSYDTLRRCNLVRQFRKALALLVQVDIVSTFCDLFNFYACDIIFAEAYKSILLGSFSIDFDAAPSILPHCLFVPKVLAQNLASASLHQNYIEIITSSSAER